MRKSKVPSGRLNRLWHIGSAASRLAAGGAREVARRVSGLSAGEHSALLTLDNAKALADRLARLRGAAMKLGQMLSLEGDSMIPKEFAEALAVLRDRADTMPREQVEAVLSAEYGADWDNRFERFDFEPIASASIGQVHRAIAKDGRDLALKIQYPGVAQSIDSDVDNLSALLNLSRLVPSGIDVTAFVAELKRQLREEVDYLRELEQLEQYRARFAAADLRVPHGYADLTTRSVLAMEYVQATPLARFAKSAPRAERDALGARLIELVLREFFVVGLVQTDPNLSNFYYEEESARLVLFDFGATRELPERHQLAYHRLLRALLDGSARAMTDALEQVGFVSPRMHEPARALMTEMGLIVASIFQHDGPYDFGQSELPERFRALTPRLIQQRAELEPPPPELVFFQRKLSGTFLICRMLDARVDCRRLVEPHLAG